MAKQIAEAATGNQNGSLATTPNSPMAGARANTRNRVLVYSKPNISQIVKPHTTMCVEIAVQVMATSPRSKMIRPASLPSTPLNEAAAATGFTLGNNLLIIVGALVGFSGAILSYIMCKAMNRSIINVVFGGFGSDSSAPSAAGQAAQKGVKSAAVEDAIYWMEDANKVIVIPGYGMAVAQAQHAVRDLATLLSNICPDPQRVVVGMSELLINAVEHGNLGITYDEKGVLKGLLLKFF